MGIDVDKLLKEAYDKGYQEGYDSCLESTTGKSIKAIEEDFKAIWNDFPNRLGSKQAFRHYKASVKTEQDKEDIRKALNNYVNSRAVKDGFIQHGSTWFNNWRDWVDYKAEFVADKKISSIQDLMNGE